MTVGYNDNLKGEEIQKTKAYWNQSNKTHEKKGNEKVFFTPSTLYSEKNMKGIVRRTFLSLCYAVLAHNFQEPFNCYTQRQ